ncbi:MAG TPA: oligosaccharide flippase family protein [Thermoanaerobaculia bacterium]|nr:oligosaccharide flippase family protein [Thermoanaerobaculia bacterium]
MLSGSDSTERRFLHSTLASYAGQLLRLGVGFAAKMVLARLILPDGFGVYEQALRLVTIAAAVRDLGLPYQLMRDARRPYGTVLAFVLASGGVVTLALVLGAPLTAVLTPELPPVVRVFALWVLLDGLAVVPRAYFERELRIGRLVGPEIGRGVVIAAVSIVLAWQGFGVWSLVIGDLAAAAVFAALVWGRARGRMPLAIDRSLLPDLLRRSAYLFQIWVLVQLVHYVDVYIVEAYRSTAIVGQYSRAYWIAFLVPLIVAPRAMLPALVAYRDDPERFAAAFRLGTVFLLTFQVTACYFLFLNAERTVEILLGPGWPEAASILRILCFAPLLQVFTDLGGEVLKVRHEDRTWLGIMAVNLAALLTAGVLLTRRYGAEGMAVANLFLLGDLWMAWRMARIFGPRFRALLRDLALVYLLPLPFFLTAAWLTPAGSWTRFAASAAAALAGWALLAHRFQGPYRSFFGELRAGARQG